MAGNGDGEGVVNLQNINMICSRYRRLGSDIAFWETLDDRLKIYRRCIEMGTDRSAMSLQGQAETQLHEGLKIEKCENERLAGGLGPNLVDEHGRTRPAPLCGKPHPPLYGNKVREVL
jgi:hypothetical protein